MIIGKLANLLEKEFSSEPLQKGFQFLHETNFADYQAGVHRESDDLLFIVNEYETKAIEEGFWEAHRKCVDFHYMLEGKERIAIDHIDNQLVTQEYDEESDVILFEGEVPSLVTLNPGDVMVSYPEDSHMTGIQTKEKEKVRKIVLKVQI